MSTTSTVARPTLAVRSRRLHLRATLTAPPIVLALLLLIGAALRLWMLARGVPTLDSDEATFGLMALHVPHGDWSVFMWGQPYMGSIEAFYTAPFVAALGPSAFTLRLGPMLLGLAFVATMYVMASRTYSRRIGLYSAALLAVGSPFFLVLTERAYGGYVETLFLGNLLLLLALAGSTSHGRRPWMAMLTGLVAGLALWTDLLIVPYLALVCLIFWWQRRADLRGRNGFSLLWGLLIGVAPALYYNVTHGAPTIGSVLMLTVAGSRGAPSAPSLIDLLPHNLWLELTASLPILLGGFLGGTQGTGLTPDDYLWQVALLPAVYAIALALTLGAIVLFGRAALRVARERRHKPLRVSKSGFCDAALVRRQAEAALILLAACYAGAFVLSSHADTFAAPRYLLPLFAATPVLVAQAERAQSWLTQWCPVRLPARSFTWLVPLVILLLCAWNLAGDVALTPLQTAARDHSIWVVGNDEQLLQALTADHVHTVISNDYWEGMRLTFESGETILTVMMTSPGHLGFNRYQPYVRAGLADPRPAYLELIGTAEASRDGALWRAGGYPGYTLALVDGYNVLLPPP